MGDVQLTPAEKQALYAAQVRVSPLTPRIEAAVEGIIEARTEALASALDRTERNFRLAVCGKPVRDMAENLAENRAALGRLGWSDMFGIDPDYTEDTA